MRIAVLCGGVSGEREVSFRSGNAVAEALHQLGHEVTSIDFGPMAAEKLRALAPELVFPTLHGPLGEDGTAAAVLEVLGLPYVGSGILAGALAMNKAAAKRVLKAEGLPTPEFRVVSTYDAGALDEADLARELGLPLVVKPNSGGSTLGFTLVRDVAEVSTALETALDAAGPDRAVLVESHKVGVEITVGVLGVTRPEALPSIEITYREGNYDYEAKYTAGLSQHLIPARIPADQQAHAAELALATHRLIGARGISRVDMICAPGGEIWILEINTMPGLTEISLFPDAARAAGMDFKDLVARLVSEAAR
jgi:D-alanine-D-alanine ligase